jgi:replication factor C large subunit
MKPFIHKYNPKKYEELIGQDESLNKLKLFIKKFKLQKKKAALIYGPSGIGKTSSVYCIANEFNLEIIEVNASEFRNKDNIKKIVGSAINQQSLFSKGKIILVDEVDGLSGNKDRGGMQEIAKIIKTTTFPIILTATNPWENKLSSLRSKCNLVQFNELDYEDIFKVLKTICTKEKIEFKENALKSLARMCGGDLRAATNDLEQLSVKTKKLTKSELESLSQREKQDTIINALTRIFKTTDPNLAISAFDNVNEDFDQRFLWLDKNLPKEYTNKEDLCRAYDKLSKANVFSRRIRRWQHWRFLVYINALITAGISVSKDKKYNHYTKYEQSGRLLKIYWANIKNMKKKAIALKIAKKTHTSGKEILKNIDYYKVIFKKNKDMSKDISKYLELEAEEITYLKK